MPWYVAAAGATGLSHRKQNLPCQDCAAVDVTSTGLVVAALSDGAGSAPKAELGARTTVETTLAFLKHREWPQSPTQDTTDRAFIELHETLLLSLQQIAQKENCELDALACTLIAFVAAENWLAALQVGDGLFLGRPAGGDLRLLFKPNRGEYVNETVFVTSKSEQPQRQTLFLPSAFEFLCASSDGIERVAIKYADWSPFEPFFAPLEEYMLSRPTPEQGQKDVREYLEREKFDAKIDDDRAMVLCRFLPDLNTVPTLVDMPAVGPEPGGVPQ
ncbi:MAG TPA: PP2C family serine/threonine-protein phosphatase [Planctomycetota bacterium]|nr:PP2C family serine/threonine-protein phosphatase [Planctomycetota bacterium]